MYQNYEFVFAGRSSAEFGMFVADQWGANHTTHSFGNKASIIETRLAGRITPLHYGVQYNASPLEFTMIFGAEKPIDRYQFQEIAMWLTGYQDYQWLNICQPDMEHMQFRCLIQSLTPVTIHRIPLAFEAKVICDCPYAYSYPFSKTYSLGSRATFYNESTCREWLRPTLTIEPASGCRTFSIINHTSGHTTTFSNIPYSDGVKIVMDNENCVIVEETYGADVYDGFNFEFFDLVPGLNELEFVGSGRVTISGRYLYNVGA